MLQRFTHGPPELIRKLNLMVDALNGIADLRGDGEFIEVQRGPSGGIIKFKLGQMQSRIPRTLPEIALVEIVSIHDDYLTCRAGSLTIYVAKPWALRRAPFEGQTVVYENGDSISYTYSAGRRRTATKGATSENQVMTPDYFVGEFLLCVVAYTGVSFGAGYCSYCDLNTAGRCWAKEPA